MATLASQAGPAAQPVFAASTEARQTLKIDITEALPLAPVETDIERLIRNYASFYEIDHNQLYKTLWCESRFNPNAIGDHGNSYGIAQIHLPSHPDITKTQALDPRFAIEWTSQQFKAGRAYMWTCHRNLFGKTKSP